MSQTGSMTSDTRLIFRWVLDTRNWRDDFETQCKPILHLLKPSEQQSVQRYYHVKDRAMSLGSQVLKYHAISRISRLPWPSISISRDSSHKPCYTPAHADDPTLEFNVSHQAGLVALIGYPNGKTRRMVGIDIVCVHERDENPAIDREGFDKWVSTYEDVFSPRELDDMRYNLPGGLPGEKFNIPADALQTISRCCKRNVTLPVPVTLKENNNGEEELMMIDSNVIIEAKLRRFYTFWALKEAYVKMTGEALLADWLRDLEFREVRAPRAAAGSSVWGELVRDVQVWRGNRRLKDVVMEIQAFERDYIIASAVSKTDDESVEEFPPFEILDVDRDILPFAGAGQR